LQQDLQDPEAISSAEVSMETRKFGLTRARTQNFMMRGWPRDVTVTSACNEDLINQLHFIKV